MGSFLPSVGSNRPSLHLFVSLSVCQSVTPSSICQFVSPSTRQSVYPSVHPSVCFSSSRLSVRPSVRPSARLPARPPSFNSFVSLSVCPIVCQSIRFPVCLSFHSYIRVSVSPSINAFAYLSVCSSRTSIRSALLAISPSNRLSVRLSNHPSLYPFVRPSVRLIFIYLQWLLARGSRNLSLLP